MLLAAALGAAAVLGVVLAATLGGGGAGRRSSTSTPPQTQTVPPGPLPAPAGEQFGASVNWLFNSRDFNAVEIDRQLTALHAAGATLARSDALWEATEPNPPSGGAHRYDWSFDDMVAGALAAHGLRWLPILDYSAPWAESVPGRAHSPPATDAGYSAYAAAFAARYGAHGAFWRAHPELLAAPVDTIEVWNEPDNPGFWSPAPDAARYGQLYLAARAAVRQAAGGIRVIVGGLTHPAAFLPAMLAAHPELRGQLDGVAIHPYAVNPLAILAGVRGARAALRALGLADVPLYVTEFGWTTQPPGALHYLPASLRPQYIQSTVSALGHLDCGVAAALLYTWVTPERNPSDPEQWFGIDPPGAPGGAGAAAFTAGLEQARGSRAQISLCGG